MYVLVLTLVHTFFLLSIKKTYATPKKDTFLPVEKLKNIQNLEIFRSSAQLLFKFQQGLK